MIVYFVLIALLVLSGFSFIIFKPVFLKRLESGMDSSSFTPVNSIKRNSNPVELAFLKDGGKTAFGVALYSLCAYKLANRSRSGMLRLGTFNDRVLPTSPYTIKLANIIKAKMKSAKISHLASNSTLKKLFYEMIEPVENNMKNEGLIISDQSMEKLRFMKFILVILVVLFGFYAMLFSTGFWTFLLAFIVSVCTVLSIKFFWSVNHLTSRGKEYLKMCFEHLGKERTGKGIYLLAKKGRAGFRDKDLHEFIGEEKIDWNDYFS